MAQDEHQKGISERYSKYGVNYCSDFYIGMTSDIESHPFPHHCDALNADCQVCNELFHLG